MKTLIKKFTSSALLLCLVGCAGFSRDCSGSIAGSFGADWIVVQYDYAGKPIQCFRLPSTSIANEENSDGIWWKDQNGNLVHLSGWYNRVQVSSDRWQEAAASLRVDLGACI